MGLFKVLYIRKDLIEMEFTTLSKAVSKIIDGSLITFSGMELNRAPMALVYEIARQGKKNLRTISIPNPLSSDVLIREGCVRHATFGFNGFSFEDGFVIAPNWKRAVENGLIEWKETDILEIVLALKAGSLGIKQIEVPQLKNTDYLKFNQYKKIKKGGRESVLAEAVRPDFALIHAQYCDLEGNVFIEDPLIDRLIASASKKVIVSVEKITKSVNCATIPKEKVDFIVHAKNGAMPTSCFGFYDYDLKGIRDYLMKSNAGKMGEKINFTKKLIFSKSTIDNMIISMAEFIKDGTSVATGVASPLPMIAVMFARKCGKNFDYFNCGSGAINPVLKSPAYSSVTISALEQRQSFMELTDVWEHALKGEIGTMFFGAVQIAGNGDVNITCIGDYKKPKVKLPGPAGAVTLRNLCKNAVIVTQHHTKKTFVEKVDFVTSSTNKDTTVITNLGALKLGNKPEILYTYHDSSIEEVKANTGFELESGNAKIAKDITARDRGILSRIDSNSIRYKIL